MKPVNCNFLAQHRGRQGFSSREIDFEKKLVGCSCNFILFLLPDTKYIYCKVRIFLKFYMKLFFLLFSLNLNIFSVSLKILLSQATFASSWAELLSFMGRIWPADRIFLTFGLAHKMEIAHCWPVTMSHPRSNSIRSNSNLSNLRTFYRPRVRGNSNNKKYK